jgi:hypothetical protein
VFIHCKKCLRFAFPLIRPAQITSGFRSHPLNLGGTKHTPTLYHQSLRRPRSMHICTFNTILCSVPLPYYHIFRLSVAYDSPVSQIMAADLTIGIWFPAGTSRFSLRHFCRMVLRFILSSCTMTDLSPDVKRKKDEAGHPPYQVCNVCSFISMFSIRAYMT